MFCFELIISLYLKLAADVTECMLFKLNYSNITASNLNTLHSAFSLVRGHTVSVCLKY
jgi:hypothetical protein